MPEIDPGEYDIGELGPKLKEIEEIDQLEAIRDAEREGEDRSNVHTLIESRIEKLRGDADEEAGDLDPTELTVAELGNAIRNVEDAEELEAVLEAETAGDDRSSAKSLIEDRIDAVRGSDEEEAAEEAMAPEEKYPELDHPTADKKHVRALDDGVYEDMWVYCETQQGELIDVSKELLGKARELIDGYNDEYPTDGDEEKVVAVIIGAEMEAQAERAIEYGADVAVYVEDDRLERFRHQPYTELFCELARAEYDWKGYDEPRYVLFPATNNGRDLSALVQAELDSGLASDCSGLYIDDTVISNPAKVGRGGDKKEFQRVLHMKRPDFSGFEYSTILCLDNPSREFHPQGASVIPGSFEVPDPDPDREGLVVHHESDLDDAWLGVDVTDHDQLEGGVDLTGNEVIVALGRGIGDDPTRGMELGLELADAFEDADLGITRGIVTSSYQFEGHVEQYAGEERQIGETGQVVEPELYVAAGISGAIQHKVGMDESDTIVAINTEPDADIRDFSDYYIEGDLFDVLPTLIEAVESGELDAAALAGGESTAEADEAASPAGGDDDD
ncbi:electron transfer flavoprotein alpha subunit apoprotein [Natronoarchaeum philippinense]|uniref:Electron transfer flavoprotein alpha subunit apoprotein n=1 Tax=Natronoarchaeum philippinense TaxID=558529 RepID=A0A285NTG2_NATPI|nr:electron transfer flavoprotein subunit alpha/FixB family protein [Natronoarchaeum philippinense]SNZ12780.1 electron transfer flavoprotein alpha subunit apoprotein [Natronoarchaeum philippinense]